jgi:FkbM family methyltransferase
MTLIVEKMIDFSSISNKSIIGKVLRLLLFLIPSFAVVRILQGRLKGKKWIKGSGVNGYWLGSYELNNQKILSQVLKRGNIFFDIGANAGFYSLLAAEIVGPSGKVYAFEPLPENFNYLKKHIEINGYKNIFPFQAAISDKSGFAFFKKEESAAMGHLGADSGDFKVETISIDDLVESGKLPIPNSLKIDVEGAEILVLKGAINIFKNHHPSIFLATHNKELHDDCINFLKNLGYNLKSISNEDFAKADEIFAYFR